MFVRDYLDNITLPVRSDFIFRYRKVSPRTQLTMTLWLVEAATFSTPIGDRNSGVDTEDCFCLRQFAPLFQSEVSLQCQGEPCCPSSDNSDNEPVSIRLIHEI